MKTGDKIRKLKGYAFDGTIRSVFENSKGETRIVAELDGNGMLHIFSPSQLEVAKPGQYPPSFFDWAIGLYEDAAIGTIISVYNGKIHKMGSDVTEELWREYNKEILNK